MLILGEIHVLADDDYVVDKLRPRSCGGTEEDGGCARARTRIRAAERKVIIVADRTVFESRGAQGRRGTPLCATARCLVDTSKSPRRFSRRTAIFGRFVHGKRYILTDKRGGREGRES